MPNEKAWLKLQRYAHTLELVSVGTSLLGYRLCPLQRYKSFVSKSKNLLLSLECMNLTEMSPQMSVCHWHPQKEPNLREYQQSWALLILCWERGIMAGSCELCCLIKCQVPGLGWLDLQNSSVGWKAQDREFQYDPHPSICPSMHSFQPFSSPGDSSEWVHISSVSFQVYFQEWR